MSNLDDLKAKARELMGSVIPRPEFRRPEAEDVVRQAWAGGRAELAREILPLLRAAKAGDRQALLDAMGLAYSVLPPAAPAAEPGTWKLEGYDAFDGTLYPLGDPYPSYEAARADAVNRLAGLERAQPAASSGGQDFGGIQDHVYIIHPGGRRERVT